MLSKILSNIIDNVQVSLINCFSTCLGPLLIKSNFRLKFHMFV